ncbi:hypothetical protein COOONC_16716 [Cooperia oncophora]
MPLLLLLLCLPVDATQRPNLKFPGHAKRLRDHPVPELPSPFGNKVYLKNKLLNNLNHFFPDTEETLEMLGGPPGPQDHPVDSNSIIDQPVAKGTPTEPMFSPVQTLLENTFTRDESVHHFPTLIPTEGTIPPLRSSTPPTSASTPAKISNKCAILLSIRI